jgi:hypothetical protein
MQTTKLIALLLTFILVAAAHADHWTANLENLPQVAHVSVRLECEQPTHRILHIKDWHFVARDVFAADLRDQSKGPISAEQIDAAYDQLLIEVEKVQAEQIEIVRRLTQAKIARAIFIEGLSQQEKPFFDLIVRSLRRQHATLDTHRSQLLRIGAAGRLGLTEEISHVRPLEADGFRDRFNPVDEDGNVTFDNRLIENREDTHVEALLKHDGLSIVILGGQHDLTDNLQRLRRQPCQYIQVETKAYRRIVGETHSPP